MDWQIQLQIIGEIALAMLLGGLIGIERELSHKPAGFRTQMLVAGSAALLMRLGDVLLVHFNAGNHLIGLNMDPGRIIQAIITGISFLGAGTIIRSRQTEHVEGLTTAASILLSSAIGISIALHQFILGIGVTVLSIIVLSGLRFIEKWIRRKEK
jgi:putative Mg2+ transporter-C (MgtC) family protein